MANSILTPQMISNEAARILHENLAFVGSVDRQYDKSFAVDGAKIGSLLNIRLPARYTATDGASISAYQDHVERSVPFYVSTQTKVPVSFTTADLTMSLDRFSERVIRPAAMAIAERIESQALAAAYKLVPNYTGTTSTQMTYKQFQQGGQSLTENLAPRDGRTTLLNPSSTVEFADAVKGLFQSSENIKGIYREGMMGRTGGFDVMESTFLPNHTTGTLAGTPLTTGTTIGTSTTTNAWVSTSSVTIDGATSGTTLKAGDIVTFGTVAAGIVDCNYATKASYGRLKKFVVQADVEVVTAGTATVVVSPAIIYGSGNAYQNCIRTKADTDNMTVTLFGVVNTTYGQNLQFQKGAFTFGTADLVLPEGVWGARTVLDGISVRIIKDYNITDDSAPCRMDVLWGFAGIYADQHAVRGWHAL